MHTPPSSRGCCFLPRAPCLHRHARAKAKHLAEVCALNPQKGGKGSCASSIPRHSALLHTPVFTGVLLLSPRAVLAQAREGKGKAPQGGVCIESSKRRGRKLRQAAFHDIPPYHTPNAFSCSLLGDGVMIVESASALSGNATPSPIGARRRQFVQDKKKLLPPSLRVPPTAVPP